MSLTFQVLGHHWKTSVFLPPSCLDSCLSVSLQHDPGDSVRHHHRRIILQKHPRKSIHIWYIRLIVIFFLPIPMNAELPSTSLDLAYSCVKCQVLTGRGATCARPPPSRAHGRDVGETARCAPAVEEETSCCASATSRCAPAVEEESCCTVAKEQLARCAASVAP